MLADPAHQGAVGQVASQFNCLEFVSSYVTPEHGITGYANDHTQGPACAIACGAGTAFRNYLVDTGDGQKGQRKDSQINMSQDVLNQLASHQNSGDKTTAITVRNGCTLASSETLHRLHSLVQAHQEKLIGMLRLGIQRDTEVTYPTPLGYLVTQVYASAIPVSYGFNSTSEAWEPIVRMVLQGAYEATLLLEAIRKHLLLFQQENSTNVPIPPTKVYLTLVGCRAFGNAMEWIWDAMKHAHQVVLPLGVPLDVFVVHCGCIPPDAEEFVQWTRTQTC